MKKLGMVPYTYNPSTEMAEASEQMMFEASLVYI